TSKSTSIGSLACAVPRQTTRARLPSEKRTPSGRLTMTCAQPRLRGELMRVEILRRRLSLSAALVRAPARSRFDSSASAVIIRCDGAVIAAEGPAGPEGPFGLLAPAALDGALRV